MDRKRSGKKEMFFLLLSPLFFFFLLEQRTTASGVFQEELKVGATVTFGHYEQDGDTSEQEQLEWRVLAENVEEGKALLITEECIACMPYHTEKADVTWEDSSLCQWLNSVFLQEAFSETEREQILETDLETRMCEETEIVTSKDRVFLLSDEEAEKYFPDKGKRCVGVSEAVWKETKEEEDETEEDWEGAERDGAADTGNTPETMEPAVSELTDSIFWWLRTPGDRQDRAECVGAEGSVVKAGYLVIQGNFGVRPAIWVESD